MNETLRKFNFAVAIGIAHLPFNGLRLALYRLVFGYHFGRKSRIDFGVIIHVADFRCGEGTVIRRRTSFVGPMSVRIGNQCLIGRDNRFMSGAIGPREAEKRYRRLFAMGDDGLINDLHIFDVMGAIELGARTWIAGYGSHFLSHGAGVMLRDIAIGADCFIGSAARFTPNSGVGSRCIVGMGAVVASRITRDDAIIAGVPARVLKDRSREDAFEFRKEWA